MTGSVKVSTCGQPVVLLFSGSVGAFLLTKRYNVDAIALTDMCPAAIPSDHQSLSHILPSPPISGLPTHRKPKLYTLIAFSHAT